MSKPVDRTGTPKALDDFPTLTHLTAADVVNPFDDPRGLNPRFADTEMDRLRRLWSTEALDEETGFRAASTAELESLWASGLSAEITPSSDEISHDNPGLDADSFVRRAGSRFRVDRPPPVTAPLGPRVEVGRAGRFAVLAEARQLINRAAARLTRHGSEPAPAEESAARANRPTVFQRLMSDED